MPPTWPCTLPADVISKYNSHCVKTGSLLLIPDRPLKDFTKFQEVDYYDNTVFVFEIPGPCYTLEHGAKERKRLLDAGELNPARLELMSQILIAPQPIKSCSVTVAESGHFPHYQVNREDLEKIPLHSRQKVQLASSFTKYVQQYILPQPWKFGLDCFQALALATKSFVCEANKGKLPDGRGQKFIVDLGFAAGQAHIRNAEVVIGEDGTSMPGFKKDPMKYFKDRDLTMFLIPISNLLKVMKEDGFLPSHAFGMSHERIQDFAARLGGVFEAFRIAVTDATHKCKIHTDQHNCPDHPHFVVFSEIVWMDGKLVRVSLILYTRKSIRDYYIRRESIGKMTEALTTHWKGLHVSRKSSFPHPGWRGKVRSLPGCDATTGSDPCPGSVKMDDFYGITVWTRPCGMDPGCYLGSSLHAMSLLIYHQRLSYVEVVSAMVAWSLLPSAPVYFVAAAHLLLGASDRSPRTPGALFGLDLYSIMYEIRARFQDRRERNGEGYLKIPGLRYGASGCATQKDGVPTVVDWVHRVECQLKAFKSVHDVENSVLEKEKNKKDGASASSEDSVVDTLDKRYAAHAKKIIDPLKKCGDLGGSHYIGFAAALGLLPFWMLHHVAVSCGSNLKKLGEAFEFDANADNARMARRALQYVFTEQVLPNSELPGDRPVAGRPQIPKIMCFRCTENIECKYCRFCLSQNQSDKRHGDLHVRGQFLVNIMYKGMMRIFEPNTGNSVDMEEPLFPNWQSDHHKALVSPGAFMDGFDLGELYSWRDPKMWPDYRKRPDTPEPEFCRLLRNHATSNGFHLKKLGIVATSKRECKQIYEKTQRDMMYAIRQGRQVLQAKEESERGRPKQQVGWGSY